MSTAWQISIIALWGAFIVQCVFILALLRHIGMIVRRLPRQGPAIDQTLPARTVADSQGQKVTLGKPSPQPRLLMFMSRACPICDELIGELPAFVRDNRGRVEMVVVTDGERQLNGDDKYGRMLNGGTGIRLADAPELVDAYRVPGTPYAVVLDRRAVVRGARYVNRRSEMQELLAAAESPAAEPAERAAHQR